MNRMNLSVTAGIAGITVRPMTDAGETCMRNSCELTHTGNLYVCRTTCSKIFPGVSYSHEVDGALY